MMRGTWRGREEQFFSGVSGITDYPVRLNLTSIFFLQRGLSMGLTCSSKRNLDPGVKLSTAKRRWLDLALAVQDLSRQGLDRTPISLSDAASILGR